MKINMLKSNKKILKPVIFILCIVIALILWLIVGVFFISDNSAAESVYKSGNFVMIDTNHYNYGFTVVYHKSTKVVYALTNRMSDCSGFLTPLYDSDGSILLYNPDDWE